MGERSLPVEKPESPPPAVPPLTPSGSQIPVARPSEPRVLRPRRAAPGDAIRPTRAEVNLASLRHNLRVIQRAAGTSKVWAVLKADGYGHGAPAVARTLERAGAHGFCVALLEEAIELREAGIFAPILVMGGYYPNAHAEVIHRSLIPAVYDDEQLEGFARASKVLGVTRALPVHLKVDTGMARLGVTPDRLEAFAARLNATREIEVSGLMTHFGRADAATVDDVRGQLGVFEDARTTLAGLGIRPSIRHAANSAALLRGEALLDVVRPGIALFGVSPTLPSGAALSSELQLAMRVRSEIVDLRTVKEGAEIGYGGLWRAKRPSRIATIPMGYADGLSRHLTNRGHLLVRGKRAPIVSAVSMDMSMIDVTDIAGVGLRDEVVVLGTQEGPLGTDTITADEIARHCDTIPWEVLCAISRRVPRFYREP